MFVPIQSKDYSEPSRNETTATTDQQVEPPPPSSSRLLFCASNTAEHVRPQFDTTFWETALSSTGYTDLMHILQELERSFLDELFAWQCYDDAHDQDRPSALRPNDKFDARAQNQQQRSVKKAQQAKALANSLVFQTASSIVQTARQVEVNKTRS